MAKIDDVAAYVVAHFHNGISTMKLQKLCYLAQGWHLALLHRPLFANDFEAWKNGPVSRELYVNHRRQFSVDSWAQGDVDALTEEERIVVDAMLQNYEALSGVELSELTHRPGTPWSKTRVANGAAPGDVSTAVISKTLIEKHFCEKLISSL